MTDVMEAGSGPAAGVRQPGEGGPGLGRSGRMSRQRKVAAVLRLLRGEDLELVSRSLGVTAATLSGWREAFLGGGEAALATKPGDAKDLALDRLKAKLGEVVLERELMAEKIAVLEAGRPLGRRRPRR
jgi:transposase